MSSLLHLISYLWKDNYYFHEGIEHSFLLHATLLTQEVRTLLILEATPPRPVKLGGNHSSMLYAASIISYFSKFIKQQEDIPITFAVFNGKLGDILGWVGGSLSNYN